jgi:NAD+ synthase
LSISRNDEKLDSQTMDDKRQHSIIRSITQFIKSEIKASESEGVIVGMSGGVDSSVATLLTVKALGAAKVFGLILPDSLVTPKKDTEDAKKFAKKFAKETWNQIQSYRSGKNQEPVLETSSKK